MPFLPFHYFTAQISTGSQSNLKFKMSVKVPIPLATNMAAALLDQEQFAFLEINFGKMNSSLYNKPCFKHEPEWPKFWFMHIWSKSHNPTSLSPLLKDYTSEEETYSSEKHLCALALFPLRLPPGGKNNLRSRISSSKPNNWRMRGHLLWRQLSSNLFPLMLILCLGICWQKLTYERVESIPK